jgi:hypothetical protein
MRVSTQATCVASGEIAVCSNPCTAKSACTAASGGDATFGFADARARGWEPALDLVAICARPDMCVESSSAAARNIFFP